MRVEKDFLGEREIPAEALYGIHSLRAAENFALGYRPAHPRLIRAMILVKKAAAQTWESLGVKVATYRFIIAACDSLLSELPEGVFIVDALQGGAGTSSNMNINEVIANTALQIAGKHPGDYMCVHPLEDVNLGQSTNDVYPTALRIAAVELLRELSGQCGKLQDSLQRKENEFADVKKLGRTELMDAVPVTLGAEFGAYAQAIARDRWRLYKIEERLRQVNLGGAAVGREAVAPGGKQRKYRQRVVETLRQLCGIGLAAAEYPMDITQNCDVFVEVSGLLKALSVNLTKIANDFRLMASGPSGGIGEIFLAPLQAGSSIMPGKVNPVLPEMVMQCAIKVQANDYAIGVAASRGEFELNAFVPLIADALLESLSLLARSVLLFRERCVEVLTPNRDRCAALLASSSAFAMAWVPCLGYETVARILSENGGDLRQARQALEEAARRGEGDFFPPG
ncbi:MAG: aspartate ammonia-lyase [Desulfovibrio sp.]|jgi:aspartate ammonia-lyase|nr:aspartate ammonia-lyase [Desulfovibrio sp.]